MKLPELVIAWSLAIMLTISLCVVLFDEWQTALLAVIAIAVGLLFLFDLTFNGYNGLETLLLLSLLVFWVVGFCTYFTSSVQTSLIALGIVGTCILAFYLIGSSVQLRLEISRNRLQEGES
ncbi:hypothetical protein ACKAMS_30105 [Rhodococcus sp. 5A-K4]|uniref:hypothetical protein n=1 Tax=Rhodococcus TaxID=1827 RepID=UPI000E53CC5B|nr:hypothetical protein [Rhodococcus sp. WY5]RGP48656.1 hypothetical protein AWH04_26225 [Rhodococcus erythropolis]